MITLGVADIARARSFYEALGWKASSCSNANVVFFQMQGSVLGLFGETALAEDARLERHSAGGFKGSALALNVEREEMIREVLDAVVAAGGTILKEPETPPWGGVSSYFADPDGHAWEVGYQPGFPFRADGTLELPE